MSTQKKQNRKSPPSEMIRVPVALKEAVRELSRLHRQGRTNEVLKGIQELVSTLDSTADIDSNASIQQLQERVVQLESRLLLENTGESQLLVLQERVAQLESRLESKEVGELDEQLAEIRERIEQLETAYNQLIIYLNNMSKRKQPSSR